METVKGDIGYFARALQIHFCGNELHGKDFSHRFYSSFIEFFFGNMRYFHDKVYYSLFWCNFISSFPLVELNISESTKMFCAQFI